MPGLGKSQRQRKPYITAPDNSHFQLAAFEELWFSFGSHEMQSAPVDCAPLLRRPKARGTNDIVIISVSFARPETIRRLFRNIH
jgi:hypothetical protein